jgi:hypothetical protein
MLNEVKHLAIAREILRCDQTCPRAKRRNDIVHHLTCDRVVGSSGSKRDAKFSLQGAGLAKTATDSPCVPGYAAISLPPAMWVAGDY